MKKLDFNPLVSIVIPVYNGENYLAEAIDSALAQTYKNIEIIVVNDGSIDSTEKIIRSYGDKVRYFKKENGGVATALNLGIKKAKGEYVSWLSHDDLYLKDKVLEQIKFLKKHKNKEQLIVFSNYIVKNMFTGGRTSDSQFPPEYTTESFNKNYYENCLLALFNSWINGCTLLIPKKALLKCKLFTESQSTTQDYTMWFALLKNNYKFIYLKKKLFVTRYHTDQDTQKKLELHYRELNHLYSYAYDLFADIFGKYSFEEMSIFLDVLRDRKLDIAYRHMLFSWTNYGIKKNSLPKIWLYWESVNTNIPDYIRLCWKTIVTKNKGDFEILCLDQYAVRQYLHNLNLNYLLYEKSAHKADYIRFKLLEKYGGFWLDSDFICLKSLLPLVNFTDTNDLWIGGYKDKSKKTNVPLIHFLASKPKNAHLKNIIDNIEEFFNKNLIKGQQPTWDELGSQLITKLKVPYRLLSSKKYFSPIEIWNYHLSNLYKSSYVEITKNVLGQMLTTSGFDSYTRISKMNEGELIKMKNVMGKLWRISLGLKENKLVNPLNLELINKEKKILDKIYLFPFVGHILVRIYLRLKKIMRIYHE